MAKAPNEYSSTRNSPRSKILFYPDDPPEIYLLITQLIENKYYVTRASKHHIKHREVNYYSSGVTTIDGEGRHPEKGPQALLALLERRYPKRRGKGGDPQANPVEPTSPPSAPIFKIDLDDLDIPDDYDPVPSDSWDDDALQ